MSGAPGRVAAVGMSIRPQCGVRDHATLLAGGLGEAGVGCSLHWCQREASSLRAARSEHRAWLAELSAELARERPDALLLHYSVFAFSHRGVPLLVPATVDALRQVGAPLIVFGHELAFPWRQKGWRGDAWALSQRAALLGLVRAASGIVLTADFRLRWLSSRRWLPRRPLALAPVFSNLPPPAPEAGRVRDAHTVGVFGYRYDACAIALALDAVALLRERVPAARLVLLGAPGARSASGRAWLAAARERGVESALSFSGPLPAQELSDALAACPVLLFADAPGPASRKGTLAGSLASGRPLVAVDGHRRWDELVSGDAVRLVGADAPAVAGALAGLLADERGREELGARGRAFAEHSMGLERTVAAVQGLLPL
ncbi:MAG TPA: glycosyltransferase [Solirubrobacteraceae bacterium]|nr:glycosyltransferase [Solirubrobacteraceae bacterium]